MVVLSPLEAAAVVFFGIIGALCILVAMLAIFVSLFNARQSDEERARELEEFRATLEAEGQHFIDRHFQAVEQQQWESLARERARRQ